MLFRKSFHINCSGLSILLIMVFVTVHLCLASDNQGLIKVKVVAEQLSPNQVVLNGLLGESLDASLNGRLKSLPGWGGGRFIKLFSKDTVAENSPSRQAHEGTDWLGEHAGKWMIAAAKAAYRTKNKDLQKLLFETADFLISQQDQDGYLGTYAPSVRFTSDKRKDFTRTWDIWANSYNILGLLEINKYWPDNKYLNSAKRIGNLLYKTFYKTGNSVSYRGSHYGLSGTILLEPVIELYKTTSDKKFLDFAEEIVNQIEERPQLKIVSNALNGTDVSELGDGKIYQLEWNVVGIVKLYEITGNLDYLHAAENIWQNIATDHLTPEGGPWGGIARHRETFNTKGYWSPYGWVETCNTMSWIQLTRELLRLTGESKYAEMIEQATYNSLLAAQFPDGEQWSYFIFPNGRRHAAAYRDCCRSSGMLSLEEVPELIYTTRENGVAINMYAASAANLAIPKSGMLQIVMETKYPLDGIVRISVSPEKTGEFPIFLRIPSWADGTKISVNGQLVDEEFLSLSYLKLTRKWKKGDAIEIHFPMKLRTVIKKEQELHRGNEIYRIDWVSLARGPLVYAVNGLISGREREEKLSLPISNSESAFTECAVPAGFNGPAFQMKTISGNPVVFLPYYEAGGRQVGTWRLTWFQVDWQ